MESELTLTSDYGFCLERLPQIGGRARTVTGDGDRCNEIEVGASDFSEDDGILNTLVRDVGLQPTYTEEALSEALGVWDGSPFRYSQTGGKPGWWNFARMAWKYGSAPQSTQRLVDQTMDGLRSDFGHPSHTYKSVGEFVRRNALNSSTTTLAEPYLQQHSISQPFITDIVQAATRAIYAQDLDVVHGFAALSAMANGRGRRVSIDRGNWRLFDRMIKLSDAQKRLNVKVTSITRHDNGTFSLSWAAAPSPLTDGNGQAPSELFDSVVIAAPFDQADITISPLLHQSPPPTSYLTQHVTVFTSPNPLSASSLGLPLNTEIPDTIWTTPGSGTQPLPFSRLMKRETQNREGCVVYNLSVDPFPYRPTPPYDSEDPNASPEYGPIRWIDREVWPHAYPLLGPIAPATLDIHDIPVELAPNLYYTSGLESVLGSFLELSAYMGRNVAELLWSKWLSKEVNP